ncbi:MAG: bifunctional pyr operon transcriptional regulator/uracil phosphoribosyltransferase PyrR [Firmicutes bacterium]|nr:bifunctional pyr operon transcriptional regulator/uracil phosphoribosyltransferase PyrR [Bacillota bacterium]
MKKKVQLMDEVAVKRALTRLSFEIVEKSPDPSKIVLVGIKTRGLPIASRIAANIKNHSGIELPVRELDITFYRDDLSHADADPTVKKADLGLDIHGKEIIICDDVLYTGRTVRAAIEAIFSQGRPAKIGLAVLIDRGHRELPIRPDYVGKNVPTSQREVVKVSFEEVDGQTGVDLYEKEENE